MIEFKVGDKVCDPFLGKNGLVIAILDDNTFPIRVVFEDGGNDSYTTYGCLYSNFITRSIFHGHIEPGTGKVTFTPKKEPVYEWQWLIKKEDGSFTVSAYREYTDDHVKGYICSDGSIWYSRIEESKREVKS